MTTKNKNKETNSTLNRDLAPDEINSIMSHFQSKYFNDGIIKDIDMETAQNLLANPDDSKNTLEKLAMYYYISNGDIFQLFDLTRILPTMNYNIRTLKRDSKTDKNMLICKTVLKNINHKELSRDILSQLITSGTLTGIWLGDKKESYLMIFDDLEFFFPAYRRNGKWVVWCDLAYFDKLDEFDRSNQLENLSPYVTLDDYTNYKNKNNEYRFVELPLERTVCLRTHTLKRNQAFGIPWISQGLYDLLHKKKLRDLEKSVANKIINAIAVLTIGNEENPNLKMNKNVKKKIYGNTKLALEKNTDSGIAMIGIPEFAKLEFPTMKSDALEPNKFESINNDITNTLGYSRVLTNGTGGNFASAKLNLDIIFRRISELLELVESEVYGKLFNIILPKSTSDNYYIEYDKSYPLTNKEKVDIYMKLHSMGYTVKSVIENIGDDYEEFIEDTLYEIDKKKLREKVIPPLTSYTITGEDNGRPTTQNGDVENDNTVTSKDNDSNNTPRADV